MPNFKKLNDANYINWNCLMEAHLTWKELWDIIDGSESKPAGSASIKAVRELVKTVVSLSGDHSTC